MHYIVYQITNKINGKIYVGKHQTDDLHDGYMGSGTLLKRAMTKYGIAAFNKEILFDLESEELMNAKEADIVTEEFCARSDTYNICPGGRGGFGYINQNGLNRGTWHSETKDDHMRSMAAAARESLAEKRQDSEWTAQWRANVSTAAKERVVRNGAPFDGKRHSSDSKKLIGLKNSLTMRGKGNSQHGTAWITDGIVNRKVPGEDPIPSGWRRGRVINVCKQK